MLGYDDVFSLNYMGTNLRPYWNRNGDQTILSQFLKAQADYPRLMKECAKFDRKLYSDAKKAGGEDYADLWQPDGIHLLPEFYPRWAANLIFASWGEIADA